MINGHNSKSFLFTLRIWIDPNRSEPQEWRGKLQALPDGEAYYFGGWPALLERLEWMLSTGESIEQRIEPEEI